MEEPQQKIIQLLSRIRLRRLALKFTQYDMADKLTISQHAYSKIESGASQLSVERFFQIADALELTVEELVGTSNCADASLALKISVA